MARPQSSQLASALPHGTPSACASAQRGSAAIPSSSSNSRKKLARVSGGNESRSRRTSNASRAKSAAGEAGRRSSVVRRASGAGRAVARVASSR